MITIPLRPFVIRLILFLALAAGFGLLGWMIVNAAIGDSIMTFVQRNPRLSLEAQIEGADLAAKYSSRDPLIHLRRGGVYFAAANEDMAEERLAAALAEMRKAAEMSPEDYRVWLALGRAFDRNGSTVEARAALERALRLAPNHFDTRWALGNHLLRAGDREASFAQMKQALANRPSALPLVFDYAWEVYRGDGKAIAGALDPPIEVRAQMVAMLIMRNKVDDGLSIWREMSAPTQKDIQRVTDSLVNTGRYAIAYDVWKAANVPDKPGSDVGSLLGNGSFERKFSFNSTIPFFAWRVTPGGGVRVTLDRKEREDGEQGLRLSFDLSGNTAFTIAAQNVPVKPNQKYCLSFFAKTEDLESLSNPLVEIFDSADINRARAATEPLPLENNPWKRYEILVTTSPATEALTVRLQRPPCPEPPCPITGRLWFDDFKLTECSGLKSISLR